MLWAYGAIQTAAVLVSCAVCGPPLRPVFVDVGPERRRVLCCVSPLQAASVMLVG